MSRIANDYSAHARITSQAKTGANYANNFFQKLAINPLQIIKAIKK
ncbi:MAG: hypothetical protein ACI8ZM_000818 [Crocinitomix sp.]|jgi:hypothetical protein